jgi:hypothetical protein
MFQSFADIYEALYDAPYCVYIGFSCTCDNSLFYTFNCLIFAELITALACSAVAGINKTRKNIRQ